MSAETLTILAQSIETQVAAHAVIKFVPELVWG
jgi:hypothetical protein